MTASTNKKPGILPGQANVCERLKLNQRQNHAERNQHGNGDCRPLSPVNIPLLCHRPFGTCFLRRWVFLHRSPLVCYFCHLLINLLGKRPKNLLQFESLVYHKQGHAAQKFSGFVGSKEWGVTLLSTPYSLLPTTTGMFPSVGKCRTGCGRRTRCQCG